MTNVDLSIITHRLKVDLNHILAKQERRKFATERNIITDEEVQELLEIGSVVETQYLNWLTDVVIVEKKMGRTACASTSHI